MQGQLSLPLLLSSKSFSTQTLNYLTTMMITGTTLVDFVNEKTPLINNGSLTRTDMIKDAGYLNDNGTAAYVAFYTELLKAKQTLDPTYISNRDVEDAEYEALSGADQDFYDAIHDMFGVKWDHEMIIEFMDELKDIGIDTPEALDDSYEYQSDSYKAEEEFAEYFVTDVLCETIPSIVEGCIDWSVVWSSSLRYDYITIEFDSETFFFRNI